MFMQGLRSFELSGNQSSTHSLSPGTCLQMEEELYNLTKLINKDEDEEEETRTQVHSFEIDRLQVEAVKKRCVFDLDTPLLEEVCVFTWRGSRPTKCGWPGGVCLLCWLGCVR